MARKKKPFVDEENGEPVPKKRAKKTNPHDKAEIDDEDEPDKFRTIKCALNSIIKEEYREHLTEFFFNEASP